MHIILTNTAQYSFTKEVEKKAKRRGALKSLEKKTQKHRWSANNVKETDYQRFTNKLYANHFKKEKAPKGYYYKPYTIKTKLSSICDNDKFNNW